MSERTYLVAIDAWNTSHDVSAVKDFIKTTPLIVDWWNYIPYVFLLVSSLSAEQLTEVLRPFTKDAALLVIEANPGAARGLLPKTAWKWLDRRAQQSGPGYSGVGGAVTYAGGIAGAAIDAGGVAGGVAGAAAHHSGSLSGIGGLAQTNRSEQP